MFCVFFCWIFENNCPGVGVLARFFCSRGLGFAHVHSLCQGVGEFALSKNSPAGWSGLKLTDALILGANAKSETILWIRGYYFLEIGDLL